jgi:hypothetical protein
MLSLTEIGPALYGAWRLARFDANGMNYFDRSLEGFWRSFRVAVLAAPFSALLIGLDLSSRTLGGGWFRIIAGESIAYIIGWVAFPLAAFYLIRAAYLIDMIDRRAQYLGFIVAYNWSQLIQLAVVLPAVIIAHSGILPVGIGQDVNFAAYVAVLIYEWFVVRTALSLPGFAAAGVVLIDVVFSLSISAAGDLIARAS